MLDLISSEDQIAIKKSEVHIASPKHFFTSSILLKYQQQKSCEMCLKSGIDVPFIQKCMVEYI